jgi:hypothetical protein
VLSANSPTKQTTVNVHLQTQGIKLLLLMEELKFRIETMVDQVQEVHQEILGMVRGTTTVEMVRGITIVEGSGTTQVRLSKGVNQLILGTLTQGMQYGVTTVMRKVI